LTSRGVGGAKGLRRGEKLPVTKCGKRVKGKMTKKEGRSAGRRKRVRYVDLEFCKKKGDEENM